ncbi:MAG: hypothetical protein V4819_07290 [Verrucomicrobiota bacterium]
MPEKPVHHPESRPPEKPLTPDPPNDGFPAEKDVSTPPPGSDQSHQGEEGK